MTDSETDAHLISEDPCRTISERLGSLAARVLGGQDVSCFAVSCTREETNYVSYRLDLSDGSSVIAQVYDPAYPRECIEDEVTCLDFVRDSKHFGGAIPVPKVLAYDIGSNNALQAPYMLLELIEGRVVTDLERDVPGINDRLTIIRAAAELHARLLKPLPNHLSKIGFLAQKSHLIQ